MIDRKDVPVLMSNMDKDSELSQFFNEYIVIKSIRNRPFTKSSPVAFVRLAVFIVICPDNSSCVEGFL